MAASSAPCRILRDAALRAAPQDEEEGSSHAVGYSVARLPAGSGCQQFGFLHRYAVVLLTARAANRDHPTDPLAIHRQVEGDQLRKLQRPLQGRELAAVVVVHGPVLGDEI